jgi:hypothetical protein
LSPFWQSLFYVWWPGREYLNSAVIISIDDQAIKMCINGPTNHSTGQCTYYNEYVYVFGGNNGSVINECEMYSIENDKWSSIAPISMQSNNNSSVISGNFIYVTGYSVNCILKYHPIQNIFKSFGNLQGNHVKRIFTANEKLCIFDKNIYESSSQELTEFKL